MGLALRYEAIVRLVNSMELVCTCSGILCSYMGNTSSCQCESEHVHTAANLTQAAAMSLEGQRARPGHESGTFTNDPVGVGVSHFE